MRISQHMPPRSRSSEAIHHKQRRCPTARPGRVSQPSEPRVGCRAPAREWQLPSIRHMCAGGLPCEMRMPTRTAETLASCAFHSTCHLGREAPRLFTTSSAGARQPARGEYLSLPSRGWAVGCRRENGNCRVFGTCVPAGCRAPARQWYLAAVQRLRKFGARFSRNAVIASIFSGEPA